MLLMGKLTISMAIFNSYVDITRGYIIKPTKNTRSIRVSSERKKSASSPSETAAKADDIHMKYHPIYRTKTQLITQ